MLRPPGEDDLADSSRMIKKRQPLEGLALFHIVWSSMDTNVIYNINCEAALEFVDKGSVDLIFFSPPYADLRQYGHTDSQCHPDEYAEMLNLNPLGALPSTIIRMGSEAKNTGAHTAVFPVKFAEYFVKMATDPGDVVLDPFMGHGTTAIACIKNNRDYIVFEIVEENWKNSLDRIEDFKYKMIVGEKELVEERKLF